MADNPHDDRHDLEGSANQINHECHTKSIKEHGSQKQRLFFPWTEAANRVPFANPALSIVSTERKHRRHDGLQAPTALGLK